jgi:hypothetical protein
VYWGAKSSGNLSPVMDVVRRNVLPKLTNKKHLFREMRGRCKKT